MISHQGLLELIHRSDLRSTPMRFALRRRVDRQLAALAHLRMEASGGWVGGGSRSIPQPGHDDTAEQWYVADVDRYRVEGPRRVKVVVGDRAFGWVEGRQARVQPHNDDRPWPGWEIFDARPVLAGCDVEVEGATTFLERPVHRVRATPLPSADTPLAPLPRQHGRFENYELLIDAERGIILREATILYGKPLEVFEITDIDFDPDFDDDLFAFRAPDGSEPVVVSDATPSPLVPLSEISLATAFNVLVPRKLDTAAGWRLHEYRVGKQEFCLTCSLPDGSGTEHTVEFRQWAGEPLDLPARALHKINEGGYWKMGHAVVVKQHGVWVEVREPTRLVMHAPGSRPRPPSPPRPSAEQLVAWARDLVPAPIGAPALVRVTEATQ